MREATFACFSTRCRIRTSAAPQRLDEALKICAQIQQRWNFYDENSALFRANFAGEKMPLNADEIEILRALRGLIDDAFDPQKAAVFSLRAREAFWRRKLGAKYEQIAQNSAQIAQNSAQIIDEAIARKCLCGRLLDFGGVMKEAAVDLCARALASSEFVINFGGDLRTSRPLRVMIKNPAHPSEPAAAVALPAGSALCTSALYERGEHIARDGGEMSQNLLLASATFVTNLPQPPGDETPVTGKKSSAQNPAAAGQFGEQNPPENAQNPAAAAALSGFSCLACGVLSTRAFIAQTPVPQGFGALFISANYRQITSGEIVAERLS